MTGTVLIAWRERAPFGAYVACGCVGAPSCLGLLLYSLSLPHTDVIWKLAVLSYGLVAAAFLGCGAVAIVRSRGNCS
jgi:hypothetical protein